MMHCVNFHRFTHAGTNSNIVVQGMGERLPPTVRNALAAGPNLVSWSNGRPVFGVPWDDENVNRWEHSANTAVGLLGEPDAFHTMAMVVSDGSDGCSVFDPVRV